MRVIATIFFLVLLTVTQTPLGQLVKLPVLIEHFSKHKKQDGVSLLQFLTDHYSAKHNDADRSEDEQLPFKTVILQNPGFAIMPSIVKADLTLALNVPTKVTRQGFYTPQQHFCSIFHPPRV